MVSDFLREACSGAYCLVGEEVVAEIQYIKLCDYKSLFSTIYLLTNVKRK